MVILGAHHSSKKWYLAKATAEKASVGPKLSKYNRGNDFGKIFFFVICFAKLKFFSNFFFRKNPNLADPSCGYAGGHPRVGGWKMRAKTPATLSAVFFRKLIFSKKFARPCPPPLDPPPWTPPMDPPFFSNFFFSFGPPEPPFIFFSSIILLCSPLYFHCFCSLFFQ